MAMSTRAKMNGPTVNRTAAPADCATNTNVNGVFTSPLPPATRW